MPQVVRGGGARRRAVVGVALCVVLAACHSLGFENDHRLEFLAPASRSTIHLPVTIRWQMSGHARTFAVFVDRAPIQPGDTLRAIGRNDPTCTRVPGCPDRTYLEARQVYTVGTDSLTLTRIDNLSHNRRRRQLHEVTVVVLDGAGHRVGESAWYLDFWLTRSAA